MIYMGFKVIGSHAMTMPGEPVQVKRSWKARLFSLPWRPLLTHRTFIPQVPSNMIVIDERENTIVMHPSLIDKLVKSGEIKEKLEWK